MMRKSYTVCCIILSVFALSMVAFANQPTTPLTANDIQYFSTPVSTGIINVNKIFDSPEKFILTTSPISSLAVNGIVHLDDSNGFARIIAIDTDGNEYLVFDSNFLEPGKDIQLAGYCEETCSINKVKIKQIFVDLEKASLKIDDLRTNNQIRVMSSLSESQNEVKIRDINNEGKSWHAGETPISKLSYAQKEKLFYYPNGTKADKLPNLKGLEYYQYGAFDPIDLRGLVVNLSAVSSLDTNKTEGSVGPEFSHPFVPQGEAVASSGVGSMSTTTDSEKIIDGVPAYIWHDGCAPTSEGMVIGYWDTHGFPNLIYDNQSAYDMIASTEHYNDYALPIDSPSTGILKDKSDPTIGGAHANNSVADWSRTSWSWAGNWYGYTRIGDETIGLQGYARSRGYANATSVKDSVSWERYTNETNNNRPVVLIVDSDGNGDADHAVVGIGYRNNSGVLQYAAYNTWDTSIHWYNFVQITWPVQQPWAIDNVAYFNPEAIILPPYIPPAVINPNNIYNATAGTATIFACGNITESGTYTLNESFNTTGTCIRIFDDNVTLNLAGFNITGFPNGYSDVRYGVYISGYNNTIIKNGNISDFGGNTAGAEIYMAYNNNNNIYNMTLSRGNKCIYIIHSDNNTIIRNNLYNFYGGYYGIYLDDSYTNKIINNNGNSNIFITTPYPYYLDIFSNNLISGNVISSLGIQSSSNNTISDNIINGTGKGIAPFRHNNFINNINLGTDIEIFPGSGGAVFINQIIQNSSTGIGILIMEDENTTFSGGLINSSSDSSIKYIEDGGVSRNNLFKDMVLSGTGNDINMQVPTKNITFLNVSYNISKEIVAGSGVLERQWYLNINITSTGAPLQNANVTVWNITGQQQLSVLSGSNGFIETQTLRDYINNGGTRRYASNYTLKVSKTGYVNVSVPFDLDGNEIIIVDMNNAAGVTLSQGWNLVSLNLVLANNNIESVLASIMRNVIVVNSFDGGAKTYDPLLPVFSDLHTMDYLHGYWIKVNETVNLTFNGTVPSSKTLSMGTGWNLVSYLCGSEKSVTDAFGSIMDKVIVINGFDNGALTYDPELPMFSDLHVIKPKHGYWIKLNEPAVLDYGTIC